MRYIATEPSEKHVDLVANLLADLTAKRRTRYLWGFRFGVLAVVALAVYSGLSFLMPIFDLPTDH